MDFENICAMLGNHHGIDDQRSFLLRNDLLIQQLTHRKINPAAVQLPGIGQQGVTESTDPLYADFFEMDAASHEALRTPLVQIFIGGQQIHGSIVSRFCEYLMSSRGGVDPKSLSHLLGHTKASFSLDRYTHVTSEMQASAAEVMGNFYEGIMGKEVAKWADEKTEREA